MSATDEIDRLSAEIVGLKQDIEKRDNLISELETMNQDLRNQLIERDHQIADLHRVVAVAQNQTQQLIERIQTPFWRRWFTRRKALPAPEVKKDQ